MAEKTDWFEEKKRMIYIVGGIVLVLFFLLLMLSFWKISLTAILSFAGGYFFAKRNEKTK